MDYRNRDYYLVTVGYYSHNKIIEFLKVFIPSLKISAPEKHFKNGKYGSDGLDIKEKIGQKKYYQALFSCSKEDSETLKNELDKTRLQDKYCYYLKLDKGLLGQ